MAEADILAALRQRFGAEHMLVEAADADRYNEDWRKMFRGHALAVLRPASTGQVADIVRFCNAHALAIVPQGGNTGLAGGATPDASGQQIVLSLERMNRIRDINLADNTMVVEAGCVLQTVQERAAEVERLFPLSFGAQGSAQIGGVLSTNAGGTGVIRYGNARQLTLGLEVVLADGTIWNGLRRLRKNNTGYDLKQLFIGAEGTLGIITAASLQLFPCHRQRAAALVAVASPESALSLLTELKRELGEFLTAFELMSQRACSLSHQHLHSSTAWFPDAPWVVLIELASSSRALGLPALLEDSLAASFEQELIDDAIVATSEQQALAFWRLREAIPDGERDAGASIKHDVSVPISAVPAFLLAVEAEIAAYSSELQIVAFGHLGDGNIHLNVIAPRAPDQTALQHAVNRLVHDIVFSFDGSISAEHGIGQYRVEELYRQKSAVEMRMMEQLKAVMDPAAQMNPGKILRDVVP